MRRNGDSASCSASPVYAPNACVKVLCITNAHGSLPGSLVLGEPLPRAPRLVRRLRHWNSRGRRSTGVDAQWRRTKELLLDRKNERWPFIVNGFRGADGQQITAHQDADVVDIVGLELIEPDAVDIAVQSLCDSQTHPLVPGGGTGEFVHNP